MAYTTQTYFSTSHFSHITYANKVAFKEPLTIYFEVRINAFGQSVVSKPFMQITWQVLKSPHNVGDIRLQSVSGVSCLVELKTN